MTVKELSKAQLTELKQMHLSNTLEEIGEPSYDDLANVDNIFSDEEMFDIYEGTDFSNDDFTCSKSTTVDDVKRVILLELSEIGVDNVDAMSIINHIAGDVLIDANETCGEECTSMDISMAFHRLLVSRLTM